MKIHKSFAQYESRMNNSKISVCNSSISNMTGTLAQLYIQFQQEPNMEYTLGLNYGQDNKSEHSVSSFVSKGPSMFESWIQAQKTSHNKQNVSSVNKKSKLIPIPKQNKKSFYKILPHTPINTRENQCGNQSKQKEKIHGSKIKDLKQINKFVKQTKQHRSIESVQSKRRQYKEQSTKRENAQIQRDGDQQMLLDDIKYIDSEYNRDRVQRAKNEIDEYVRIINKNKTRQQIQKISYSFADNINEQFHNIRQIQSQYYRGQDQEKFRKKYINDNSILYQNHIPEVQSIRMDSNQFKSTQFSSKFTYMQNNQQQDQIIIQQNNHQNINYINKQMLLKNQQKNKCSQIGKIDQCKDKIYNNQRKWVEQLDIEQIRQYDKSIQQRQQDNRGKQNNQIIQKSNRNRQKYRQEQGNLQDQQNIQETSKPSQQQRILQYTQQDKRQQQMQYQRQKEQEKRRNGWNQYKRKWEEEMIVRECANYQKNRDNIPMEIEKKREQQENIVQVQYSGPICQEQRVAEGQKRKVETENEQIKSYIFKLESIGENSQVNKEVVGDYDEQKYNPIQVIKQTIGNINQGTLQLERVINNCCTPQIDYNTQQVDNHYSQKTPDKNGSIQIKNNEFYQNTNPIQSKDKYSYSNKKSNQYNGMKSYSNQHKEDSYNRKYQKGSYHNRSQVKFNAYQYWRDRMQPIKLNEQKKEVQQNDSIKLDEIQIPLRQSYTQQIIIQIKQNRDNRQFDRNINSQQYVIANIQYSNENKSNNLNYIHQYAKYDTKETAEQQATIQNRGIQSLIQNNIDYINQPNLNQHVDMTLQICSPSTVNKQNSVHLQSIPYFIHSFHHQNQSLSKPNSITSTPNYPQPINQSIKETVQQSNEYFNQSCIQSKKAQSQTLEKYNPPINKQNGREEPIRRLIRKSTQQSIENPNSEELAQSQKIQKIFEESNQECKEVSAKQVKQIHKQNEEIKEQNTKREQQIMNQNKHLFKDKIDNSAKLEQEKQIEQKSKQGCDYEQRQCIEGERNKYKLVLDVKSKSQPIEQTTRPKKSNYDVDSEEDDEFQFEF